MDTIIMLAELCQPNFLIKLVLILLEFMPEYNKITSAAFCVTNNVSKVL